MWAGFDRGLLRFSLHPDMRYQGSLTRCSSLAKMPLPMMATPMVMIADAKELHDVQIFDIDIPSLDKYEST
jgi:hypothetical protein